MTGPHEEPGFLTKVGLLAKRVATYVYGPPDLPDPVDPIVQIDKERGVDPHPSAPPKPTSRQASYDNLPRGHE